MLEELLHTSEKKFGKCLEKWAYMHDWSIKPTQCELIINEGLIIRFAKRKPCAWWRLWHWLLLGWRWRDV